jgi:hypothetical protein
VCARRILKTVYAILHSCLKGFISL